MLLRKMIPFFLLCLPLWATAQKKQKTMPVQVTVNRTEETNDKKLILYSRSRPLEINDFKAKPDEASYGVGATYSGILMEMQGGTENGVLKITVTLTTYFDKTKSWMKKEGKNDRVLAHEQNHFDLTAIKACALAKAISEEKFTSANVQERLRELHRVHTQELKDLQQAYDKETKHGTLPDVQAQWSARIARDLAGGSCM